MVCDHLCSNGVTGRCRLRSSMLLVLLPALMCACQSSHTTPPANPDTQTTNKSGDPTVKGPGNSSTSSTTDSSGSPTSLPLGADPQTVQSPTTPLENFPGSALFNSQPPFLAGVLVDHVDHNYREGEKLSVRFQAEQEAHLYLLYHQANGSSVLLFPNEAQRDNRVPAKTPIAIPPADNSFRFRISAPFGNEVLQVVASTKPLADLDVLIQKQGQAPAVTPELITKLYDQLALDLSTWTEHHLQITTHPKNGTAPQRPSNRIGLFVGIGKYQHPQAVPAHEELSHSAEVLHDAMLKEGRLDKTRTRPLLDYQATKVNLEEAFIRWLPNVSRPGDSVFVYFSGRINWLRFPLSSEPIDKHEAIIPYDAPAGLDISAAGGGESPVRQSLIVDDSLARWLEELSGRQIVLIMDTCHGGRADETASGSRSRFLIDQTARVRDISQINTVLIASSQADEPTLFEGTHNKTMWLTHCLTESLVNRDRAQPLTIRAAFDDSRRRPKRLVAETHPARAQEPLLVDHSQPAAVFAP